jgi:predicted membrane-bound dolichyl-phosphate-mannose-protein mannosyltransferase
MQGERNTLQCFTVQAREEEDRWGTRGYKYPQIQNSNGYIPEFGTSEKKLGTSDL